MPGAVTVGGLVINMSANVGAFRADMASASDTAKATSQNIVNAWAGVAAESDRTTAAGQRLIDNLRNEIATFGMTSAQLTQHKADLAGVGNEAQALIARLQGMKSAEEAFKTSVADTSAAVATHSKEVAGASGHMEGLSFATVGAKRELLVLAHELSQGNYKKFGGSLMVIGEQTGAAGLLFSAAGLAAIGMGAAFIGVSAAVIKGATEQREMNNALIMTGNYAGLTSDSLNALAHAATATGGSLGDAKKVATDLAASGKFTGDQIGYITGSVVAMEHATGQSIEKTIEQFESLAVQTVGHSARASTAISDATVKLDQEYHFLTLSVYDQITALEKEGDLKGASAVATEEFARVTKERSEEIIANLGNVAKAWNYVKEGIGHATDSLGDWGKKSTAASEVARLTKALQEPGMMTGVYDKASRDQAVANATADLAYWQKELNHANQIASDQSAATITQSNAVQAAKRVDAMLLRAQTKEQGALTTALNEYHAELDKIRAGNVSEEVDPRLTQSAIATAEAAITRVHSKHEVGTDDRAKTLQDALLREQIALAQDKAIYEARDQMLALYHSRFATSDDDFYAGRAAARAEYVGAEAISYAKETALVQASIDQAKNPREVAAAREKYDSLIKAHQDFVAKMGQASVADAINPLADEKKSYDKLIDSLDKAGQASVKSLNDQITKEREHGLEIGKTKEQIDLMKQAQQEAATADLQNQALAITDLLKQQDLNDQARGIYAEVLAQLNLQIAARQQLAIISGSNAVLQADADAAKKATEAWNHANKKIGDDLASAIVDGGGKGWKKMLKDMELGFAKAVLQPILAPISGGIASLLNPSAPQANGGSNLLGLANTASSAKSLYTGASSVGNALFGSGSGTVASWLAGTSSVAPTSVAAANAAGALGGDAIGTLASFEGWTTAASAAGEAAGAAAGATAGAAAAGAAAAEGGAAVAGGAAAAEGGAVAAGGAAAGEGALAAMGPYGWAALAAIAAFSIFGGDDGPEQHTRLTFNSNNAPGNISINERGNEGKNSQSYIDGSSAGAFGSFGLSSTFWSDGFSDTVQSFIKTVTKVDDVLAGYLTGDEKAAATAAVTNKPITANLGAQGTPQNGAGELDAVFAQRLNTIFESIDPGMASLISGFKGTSQELSTEAVALLQYRQALSVSGEALFGAKVTLQELAALKTPSEATSAALTRITNEFMVTNATAAALGKTAVEAFGTAGLASIGAREQLINLAGGMDALSKNTASFAQNYLSEAERLAPMSKQVDAALAELGLTGIDTRDKFKEVVQGLDLTSAAGATMYGKLMGLQDAFAAVHAASSGLSDSQQAIADQQKELRNQLDELTMTQAQLATKARDAVDSHNLALYDEVQAAQAAKDAADAAKAAADALASTNAGYQQQIDQLLKAGMSAADVRAMEIKGMDASTVALYDRLAGLKASQAAEAAAADAIKKAADAAKATADAQLSAMRSFGDGLVSSMKAAKDAAQALRDFNDSLALGSLSSLSAGGQYDLAKQQLQSAAPDKVQAAATAFLESAKANDTSRLAYARDFAFAQTIIAQGAATLDQRVAGLASFGAIAMNSAAFGANGSHAGGLDYVPFDGYRAILHKGESVKTAAETRKGSISGGMTEATAQRLITAIEEGNKHARKTADILVRVTKDGKSLLTTAG